MKELISVETIRELAAQNQKQVYISPETAIITPAARDQAKELGIEIIEGIPPSAGSERKDWKKVRETILQCLKEDFGDQQLDKETVETIVRMVLGKLG